MSLPEKKDGSIPPSSEQKAYSAESIKVLEGLEGVRMRPAMYIGSTGTAGLHHLVYEVVDNSVDEALAGHCNHVQIILHLDGSCSVEDNGRGIPVDIHPTEKVSAAEVVLTKLHAGGKFGKDSYKYSGGLHGVGVSVVNALSERLDLTVFRDGHIYQQSFQRGIPMGKLKTVGPSTKRGTVVRFFPDGTIFEDLNFSYDTLAARFRELAFLNKKLRIDIRDERSGQFDSFYFEGGIVSFIEHVNSKKVPLFPEVIHMTKDDGVYILDFACQYNDGYSEQTYSFVNNIRTMEGGTHEAGFKSALTKICNKYGQKINLLKDEALSSDDVREGLVAVLSIKVPEPQFEGQTKTKLGNSEVKGIVDSYLYAFFDSYFEENPAIARKILQKGVLAQQARSAAKKARELTRRKSVLEHSVLPGKLADCSDDNPKNTELFIVEGDSAGGSAKQGRDRFTQAILPLRGKIINVEKSRLDRMLGNNEVQDLITAIGGGIGNVDFNIEKIRYHKIIIMTDADVDGSHIRILLLTFFFRHMLPLIERGNLYIAQPPLYKVKVGKQERYLQDESEFTRFIFEWAQGHTTITLGGKSFQAESLIPHLNGMTAYAASLEKISRELELPPTICHTIVKIANAIPPTSTPDDIRELAQKAVPECNPTLIKQSVAEQLAAAEALPEAGLPIPMNMCIVQNKKSWCFPLGFLSSHELREAVEAYRLLEQFEKNDWAIKISDRQNEMTGKGILELSAAIVTLGKSLMTVQRYKGLGEMNPEQLWETTMNPTDRNLLRVNIEDAVKADEWFSALMGDAVEDRRRYIELHAHFVRNLDI